jgi:hypothetical protein
MPEKLIDVNQEGVEALGTSTRPRGVGLCQYPERATGQADSNSPAQ